MRITRALGFVILTTLAACSSGAPPLADDAPANANTDAGTTGSGDGSSPVPGGNDAGGGGPLAPIHFIGRFDTRDPKGPRASWPGVQIRARFSGTGATLRIHVTSTNVGSKPFFDQLDVSVDGAAPTLLKPTDASDSYPIATGLPDGEHDVIITKRTESFGTIQFLGIDSNENRPLVPTAAPSFTRWIEFIGDSITCGFGVLGADASCSFSADTENEGMAYGALAATALSAGHTSIAFSGIGIYRDSGGSTENQMPVRFFRTLANDATGEWDFRIKPDVVVINLGTNDFTGSAPSDAYEKAYQSFLGTLRGKYPQAYFVASLSSMMTDKGGFFPPGIKNRAALKESVTKVVQARMSAGDQRVSYLEFDEQAASDGYGCGHHPSKATQQRDSAKLVAHIKSLTGW